MLPDSYIDPVNKQYGGMIILFSFLKMLKKLIGFIHYLFNFNICYIMCTSIVCYPFDCKNI